MENGDGNIDGNGIHRTNILKGTCYQVDLHELFFDNWQGN